MPTRTNLPSLFIFIFASVYISGKFGAFDSQNAAAHLKRTNPMMLHLLFIYEKEQKWKDERVKNKV